MSRQLVCTAIIALVCGLTAACGTVSSDASPRVPASRPAAPFGDSTIEGTWFVTEVTTRSGVDVRVASLRRAGVLGRRPYIEFGHGALRGFDGVNHFSGGFERAGNRVRAEQVASTLVGLTNAAPRPLLEVRAAFSAVVDGSPATVHVHQGVMELRTRDYTLRAVEGASSAVRR